MRPEGMRSSHANDEQALRDKMIIEELKRRLNDHIQKDPKLAKKAALILESWLHLMPKK